MYNRCQICVNCGKCGPGIEQEKKMHVLTENRFPYPHFTLENEDGRRLVTVDIGTTTVAMQLYDAVGNLQDSYVQVNPQTMYGADVLSRIEGAHTPGMAAHMRKQIQGVLQKGAERFKALIKPEESLLFVVVGNTTMLYLFLGIDTDELGRAPFKAAHLEGFWTKVTTDEYPCYCLPGLSSFVGGDIVAGIYATELMEQEKLSLFIDLGTNGEMAIGDRNGIIALATAAGPAFEGGANRGIWGADMISLTAMLREREILDENGLLAEPYFDSGIRIADVLVTKQSVRALQYAKAAIAAGIKTLITEQKCDVNDIERVVLAGGFGYYLSPKAACEIGLLPMQLEKKTFSGGNTALAGAYKAGCMLLTASTKISDELFIQREKVRVINLAMQEQFSEDYVEALALKSMVF